MTYTPQLDYTPRRVRRRRRRSPRDGLAKAITISAKAERNAATDAAAAEAIAAAVRRRCRSSPAASVK